VIGARVSRVLGVVLTLAATAYADPKPDVSPDAVSSGGPVPPSVTPPNLTILPKPVPSPLHPRRRMTQGYSMGAGVYCPNVGSHSVSSGDFCTAQLRLAMDGPMMDTHVALLLGDALRVGGLFGFEVGSPYFQLGTRRQRVALAIRGSFDGILSSLAVHVPGHYSDGYLAFSNTSGPNLSIAMSPHSAFELRGAVGWTVAGFFSDHDGFDKPVYGFVAEGWLGMRFAP
jgi:hypothetical protein